MVPVRSLASVAGEPEQPSAGLGWTAPATVVNVPSYSSITVKLPSELGSTTNVRALEPVGEVLSRHDPPEAPATQPDRYATPRCGQP
jgi:hypothetical protein